MKKAIAGILIGSALLLPNNTSVEASYSNNNVQVQKVKHIECVGWGGDKFDFSNKKLEGKVINLFQDNLKHSFAKYLEEAKSAVSKSNEKQENKPSAPVEEKTPETKPVPEVEKTPEAKPVPEVEKTPEAKPAPEVEKTPEAKPAPEVEKTPETKPAPEVEKAPEATPTPTPAPTPEKPATPVEAAPNGSISAIEQAVLDLTNAERQKAGLSALKTDSNLMNSAREKSMDMSSNGYFSHTSPTHGSPFDQMKAHGVSYSSAAENIAMGQRTAEAVVKGWMESPGHRQNILTPDFTHIGIGYDEDGHYWTQQFIKK